MELTPGLVYRRVLGLITRATCVRKVLDDSQQETLLIFDWDDTLCPTTFIREEPRGCRLCYVQSWCTSPGGLGLCL